MKKFIDILHWCSILLFLFSVIFIILKAFSQNNDLLLIAGILILTAFFFSLVHFVFSLIIKIKLSIYAKCLLFSLFSFSIITISVLTNIEFLQYIAIIPLVPSYLIGFYLEHEDEIKQKMKNKDKE